MTPIRKNKSHASAKNFATSHPKLSGILQIIIILFWTTGCILLSQILLAFVFRFLISNYHLHAPLMQTIYSAVSYLVAGIIIIILPSKLNNFRKNKKNKSTSREDLGLIGWPTWTDIGLAPIGFIIYVVFAAIIGGIFSNFPWFNATEAQSLGFDQFMMGFDRALAFFTLVIVAPLAEEIIFRGYLYIKLKKSLQKIFNKSTPLPNKASAKAATKPVTKAARHAELIAIIVASLLTSIAFAIMHGQWNVGVNVFTMSIVLCLMREITGTIYSGIIMHMIKNAVAFFLVFVVNFSF